MDVSSDVHPETGSSCAPHRVGALTSRPRIREAGGSDNRDNERKDELLHNLSTRNKLENIPASEAPDCRLPFAGFRFSMLPRRASGNVARRKPAASYHTEN
jgi:hypothetical protein